MPYRIANHLDEAGGFLPRRILLCRQAQNAVCKTAHTTFMWYISAPLRRPAVLAPVCAVLMLCMGGFDGGRCASLRRRLCALWVGCGGVLRGQSVQ